MWRFGSGKGITVIASAAKIQTNELDCHGASRLAMTMFHAGDATLVLSLYAGLIVKSSSLRSRAMTVS